MTTATVHEERELDGIWFLSTFLFFGLHLEDVRNPFKVENVSYVETSDTEGFSQVVLELESGQVWRVEVERVS